MGSTPNAAATTASFPPHPAAQGIVQMIRVLIDPSLSVAPVRWCGSAGRPRREKPPLL
ncbi:hypothetical protein ACNKHQ_00035 [Shigella flexneri]